MDSNAFAITACSATATATRNWPDAANCWEWLLQSKLRRWGITRTSMNGSPDLHCASAHSATVAGCSWLKYFRLTNYRKSGTPHDQSRHLRQNRALSRVGFRTLGRKLVGCPSKPPVRHVEIPTFLTTHELAMPRRSRKAAPSSPSCEASRFIRATPNQSTPI